MESKFPASPPVGKKKKTTPLTLHPWGEVDLSAVSGVVEVETTTKS